MEPQSVLKFRLQVFVLIYCCPTACSATTDTDCSQSNTVYIAMAAALLGVSVLITIANILYWVRRRRQTNTTVSIPTQPDEHNLDIIRQKPSTLSTSLAEQSGKYVDFQESLSYSYDLIGQAKPSAIYQPNQINIYESVDQSNAPVILAPPPPVPETPPSSGDKVGTESGDHETENELVLTYEKPTGSSKAPALPARGQKQTSKS